MGGGDGGRRLRGTVAMERQQGTRPMDKKDRYIEEIARRYESTTHTTDCRVKPGC